METIYKTYRKKIRGNVWSITTASGKSNYLDVCKETNNPFGGKIGRWFNSFDEAAKAYKCPELKLFLLEVETGIAICENTYTHISNQ